jgi:broad specificity phosphatase PhoE
MKILFTRHGESVANTLHIISNRDIPHPLTKNGHAQVVALVEKLATHTVGYVYSSPVLRALQTAEIVSARLNIHLEITDVLREYDCGILEGRGDEEAWAMHQQFVHNWLAGKNRDRAPEGGETFFDIRRRVAGFVNGLVAQNSGNEAEILCVSHGGTYIFGLPGLLTNLDFDFFQDHGLAHTDIVVAEEKDGKLICRSWGEHTFV